MSVLVIEDKVEEKRSRNKRTHSESSILKIPRLETSPTGLTGITTLSIEREPLTTGGGDIRHNEVVDEGAVEEEGHHHSNEIVSELIQSHSELLITC